LCAYGIHGFFNGRIHFHYCALVEEIKKNRDVLAESQSSANLDGKNETLASVKKRTHRENCQFGRGTANRERARLADDLICHLRAAAVLSATSSSIAFIVISISAVENEITRISPCDVRRTILEINKISLPCHMHAHHLSCDFVETLHLD
jgi:hypothetical protein